MVGLLERVLVLYFAFCAVVNLFSVFYRIVTEENEKMTWKEKALTALISFLIYLFFLIWMKFEGWW